MKKRFCCGNLYSKNLRFYNKSNLSYYCYNNVIIKWNNLISIPYYYSPPFLQQIISAEPEIFSTHISFVFKRFQSFLAINTLIIRPVIQNKSSRNVALPVVDVTLPVVDVTLPVVDVTLPLGKVTLPMVDVTLPKVDVTLPKRCLTLPKRYLISTKRCLTSTIRFVTSTILFVASTIRFVISTKLFVRSTKRFVRSTRVRGMLTVGNVMQTVGVFKIPELFASIFTNIIGTTYRNSGEFPLNIKSFLPNN